MKDACAAFKVVIVGGARQVGKSTLIKHFLAGRKDVRMVTLDDPALREVARSDPALFLAQYEPPLFIDEFQYAPELLPFIKMRVDEMDGTGLYFLSGSQLFKMMGEVGESLSGRAAVLSLSSFSQGEILEAGGRRPFLPADRPENLSSPVSLKDVQRAVFLGGMPALVCGGAAMNRDLFFSSYVQTYVERDIRNVINIRHADRFTAFLACLASRTGEELVYEDLASAVGVEAKTIKSWVGVLASTGLVFLLRAWSGNATKRIVRRPKIHFMDTGLACHLARIPDAETLFASREAGHFFESWVVGQVVRSYQAKGLDPSHYLYCYRDDAQREIDLLISRTGRLHPVEIKLASGVGADAMRHFHVVDELGLERGTGCVLCLSPNVIPVRGLGSVQNVAALWR